MMKRFREITLRLLTQKWYVIMLLCVLSAGLLIYFLGSEKVSNPLAYLTYALSAYALATVCICLPSNYKKAKEKLLSNKHLYRYVKDIKFRAKVSLYVGLGTNIIFALFKILTGIIYSSLWFGAVGLYYIILCVIRFFLLRNERKTLGQTISEKRYVFELKSYRFCGWLMFVLNFGMGVMIAQMIWQNKGYEYPEVIIYASCAYAFWCLIVAIININKFKKMDSPILSAGKMLSLATALMSMLSLQTAMISKFGDNKGCFRQLMNTLTGTAVFIIVFTMAVFMVKRANKMLGACGDLILKGEVDG